MKAHTAITVEADGTYRVRATRVVETDMLSIYVDRVRKLAVDGGDALEGVLRLSKGDLIESTGQLDITPAVSEGAWVELRRRFEHCQACRVYFDAHVAELAAIELDEIPTPTQAAAALAELDRYHAAGHVGGA